MWTASWFRYFEFGRFVSGSSGKKSEPKCILKYQKAFWVVVSYLYHLDIMAQALLLAARLAWVKRTEVITLLDRFDAAIDGVHYTAWE